MNNSISQSTLTNGDSETTFKRKLLIDKYTINWKHAYLVKIITQPRPIIAWENVKQGSSCSHALRELKFFLVGFHTIWGGLVGGDQRNFLVMSKVGQLNVYK